MVLFDIDGTLLTAGGVGRQATREAMLEVFGTAAKIDAHSFAGKTDWYTLTELLAEYGHTPASIGQQLDVYVAAIERHIERLIPNYPVQALPGALEAVQQLQTDAGTLVGLVTGNMPTSARAKLRAAGFDPNWFTIGAFGNESTDRDELAKLALERAAAYCGQPLPLHRVYVVGDTVMDILCARAIGGIAVAVRTGYEDGAVLATARPDYLLEDLTFLFDIW